MAHPTAINIKAPTSTPKATAIMAAAITFTIMTSHDTCKNVALGQLYP